VALAAGLAISIADEKQRFEVKATGICPKEDDEDQFFRISMANMNDQ
jgi:hypothetical protein